MDFVKKKIKFGPGTHHHNNVIWIVFPYDPSLIEALIKHSKAKWSSFYKKWYVPDNKHYRKLFHF